MKSHGRPGHPARGGWVAGLSAGSSSSRWSPSAWRAWAGRSPRSSSEPVALTVERLRAEHGVVASLTDFDRAEAAVAAVSA
jgi:hypothetical protein